MADVAHLAEQLGEQTVREIARDAGVRFDAEAEGRVQIVEFANAGALRAWLRGESVAARRASQTREEFVGACADDGEVRAAFGAMHAHTIAVVVSLAAEACVLAAAFFAREQ